VAGRHPRRTKPKVVFAPHVETAAGIILPDDYLRAVAAATHEVGGLFVLDCIASGAAMWVDMQATGVDVLVSAPQKGWSGSPCCAFVMLSERARAAIDGTTSTALRADLKKWLQIMETYEGGAHAYHTTLPTDALTVTRDVMLESRAYGFEKLRTEQWVLGRQVRALLASHGIRSVAAEAFAAPGVVVSYTDDPGLHSQQGLPRPWACRRLRRAAAVRRGPGLQDLPHRPVRPGEVAPRGAHGGPPATPLGEMLAVASPQGLCLLEFVGQGGVQRELAQVEAARGGPVQPGDSAVLAQTAHELAEYFAGRRQRFGVPLDLVGTPFQLSAWQALLAIPYGQTRSYAEQARAIGRPSATRAVAAANGQNKVSIIVPCHRVIGSDGSLTGFGGGLPRKHALLVLESPQGCGLF
jgi:O-6-methylguanine DNA methyltransferase